ncbi:lysozyme inhibitor LprI family protein [Paraburkholderia sp. BCC1885]|uniref:lysozyme inhibitor LprI family protein n=1 Tax=Paraburkholderia sp. BCC1885 TaxID=2562669 RepID=UPI001181E34A|nr:lysozyme inhibitor LprI family protein [Paraburkholderia sp. BCC1885]
MARLQRIGGVWLVAAATVLTIASTLTTRVHAEVAAADPIDAAMRACLARSDMSSTAGQLQCMDTARLGWQSALDTAWQQLLSKVPPARRKPWQDAQTRWQASRDAQAPLLDAVFATRQGTMYQLAEADMQLQPVRDRALALRSAAAGAATGAPAPVRPRACSADALCEHATFDMNRYYHRLQTKMPARSRATLVRAQRAWSAYLEAASAVTDERGRVDIIGARVATLKRLSETIASE